MSIVGGQTNDLMGMLGLLSNQEELHRRLEGFNRAKKEAEDAVALVGPANEIPELRRQAGEDRAAAAAELAAAKVAANRIRVEATREAEQLRAQATAVINNAEKVRQEADDYVIVKHAEADDLMRATQAQAEKVETKLNILEEQEKLLEEQRATVKTLEQDLNERLTSLAEVKAYIQKAMGT